VAGNDETLRLKVEADTAEAKRDLSAVQKQADKLEGDTATVEVDADTSKAKAGLGDISDLLGNLPGPAGEVASSLGSMGGGLAAAAGPAAAVGAALFAAADSAANLAIEAKTMSELTGDSVESASALQQVWKSTGADVNDLNDIVLQMSGALSSNADAAAKLGININDGKSGGERFAEVMKKLSTFTGTAAEKSALMSALLGEEGARQGAKFLATVKDIDGALADAKENGSIITDSDVNDAVAYQQSMAELKQTFAEISVELGQNVLPALVEIIDLINTTSGWKLPFQPEDTDLMTGQITYAKLAWQGLRNEYEKKFDVSGIDAVTGAIKAGIKPVKDLSTGSADLATAFADGITSAEDWAGAVDHLAVVYGEAEKAQAAFYDAQRAAVDSQYAAEEAAQGLIDTIVGYKDAVKDAEGNVSKLKDVQDDTRESAIGYADAQVRAKQETALAAGEYRTAEQDHRDYIGALVESTTYMEGPQKQAILDYIARLEGIPPEKVSEIIADPDYQSIDATAQALDNAAKPRTAPITVEIKGLPGFYGALQAASRAANVTVTPGSVAPASAVGPSQHSTVAAVPYGGTTTNNITLNTRATAGRELTRELNRWARLNGRSRG
jgi:hypothetical protein